MMQSVFKEADMLMVLLLLIIRSNVVFHMNVDLLLSLLLADLHEILLHLESLLS